MYMYKQDFMLMLMYNRKRNIYIYIYIYIYVSCCTASMDLLDPLSPPISWAVFQTQSCFI